MKRVVIHKPGGYERLTIETHPDPTAGDNDVVVKTEAAGVNYADVCVRWGVYESAKKLVGWPITPGFEYSGVVVDIGKGVTHVKKGDSVFGVSFFNSYATHVKVPKNLIWQRPAELNPQQAAGFPAVYITAYHALLQNIRIYPGMTILVHSAAGGVGSALVQIAKIQGLRVVGVVGSSHKVEHVRSLGADVVIDKSTRDLWAEAEKAAPQGYDVILDANGPETLSASYNHLRPTGKLVVYGFHTLLPKQGGRIKYLKTAYEFLRVPRFHPLTMTNVNKSVVAFNLSFLFERDDLLGEALADLTKWMKQGKLSPPKITSYTMEDVAEAHKAIESGKTTGKLVLTF